MFSTARLFGSTITLLTEEARSRRLKYGEAERLLAACGPHLLALVEAALETGCRKGELLSLQWSQVQLEGSRPELSLPASKDQDGKASDRADLHAAPQHP